MVSSIDTTVRANLARVRERIAKACDRAGRPVEDVQLVGVSKYVGSVETAALVEAGCATLGEARPQQLWEKAAASELASPSIEWRLIGHLQRNKADRTVAVATSIDSVDSPRLLATVEKAASSQGKRQSVLLEVNCSGDAEKHGFAPDDVAAVVEGLGSLGSVSVRGLMTMAAREGGEAVARANFATLRELRHRLAASVPEGHGLEELSMGMSGDLEAAILEGSTLVRVGSALWEGLR